MRHWRLTPWIVAIVILLVVRVALAVPSTVVLAVEGMT